MVETDAVAVVQQPGALAYRHELTVDELAAQMAKIHEVMKKVMVADEDYGVIPGTGTKPTLLKPGAEKLNLLFRLDPQYQSIEVMEGPHLTVKSICTLWHIPTGQRLGSGEGSCSTKESKYAYRKGARKCPKCGKEAIIKGKEEYGGGWLCFKKKDGCGAKWVDGAAEIENQSVDRVVNEDLPDSYNTVLKMANKRSLLSAVLNVTAASAIFTVDLDEVEENRRAAGAGDVIEGEVVGRGQGQQERPAQGQQPRQGNGSGQAPDPDRKITEPQQRRLYAIARGAGWTEEQVHALLAERGHVVKDEVGNDMPSASAIPVRAYEDICDHLKAGKK